MPWPLVFFGSPYFRHVICCLSVFFLRGLFDGLGVCPLLVFFSFLLINFALSFRGLIKKNVIFYTHFREFMIQFDEVSVLGEILTYIFQQIKDNGMFHRRVR